MTRTLEFIVEGQRLKKDPNCSFSGIVAGSKGYLECHFAFSPEWKGVSKAVIFTDGNQELYEPLKYDKCKVPDAITDSSRIHIQVAGKDGGTFLRTNEAVILQKKGR